MLPALSALRDLKKKINFYIANKKSITLVLITLKKQNKSTGGQFKIDFNCFIDILIMRVFVKFYLYTICMENNKYKCLKCEQY